MGGTRSSLQQVVLLHVVLLVCMKTSVEIISATSEDDVDMKCIERERDALLMIKKDLVDEYDHLSSWGDEEGQKDCCKWRGIRCHNLTGHVTTLDLRVVSQSNWWESLTGKISPSILELQHLTYLDLSQNNFQKSRIPDFIGSLTKLRYLNLSKADFGGNIPYQLGNLSNLETLDISSNNYYLSSENLSWLSNLFSLRYLDMSVVNLTKATDWIQTIHMLPSIAVLYLSDCYLPSTTNIPPTNLSFLNSSISSSSLSSTTIPPNLSLSNSSISSSLSVLDLAGNNFNSTIYQWLFDFAGSSLVDLDLAFNHLEGPIPDAFFQNMTSLAHLDLSYNQIQGGIPKSIGNLVHLQTLILSENNINGNLPEIVWNLSWHGMDTLEILDLGSNQICGSVPDITIFSSLKELYLQDNLLNGTFPRSFQRPSKLRVLDTRGNQIKGSLPESIGQLSKLEFLDVSSNYFRGTISDAHFSNLSNLKNLYLSNNSLLILNFSSEWQPPFQLDILILTSCKLGPRFPVWLRNQKNISLLDISNSGISDVIPHWFSDLLYNLNWLNISHNQMRGILPDLSSQFVGFSVVLDLSSNQLGGPIPLLPSNISSLNLSKNMFRGPISAICATTSLEFSYLDLSDNLLSGRLPDCWGRLYSLVVLNLDNNNFSGKIPSSMGSFLQIWSLHLRNNNLIGELPSSLQNCTSLITLDVGENKLSGTVPRWIGEKLSELRILRLRSNEFYGNIPVQLCYLSHIHILHISLNNITGTIPRCLKNFTAMTQKGGLNAFDYDFRQQTASYGLTRLLNVLTQFEYVDHSLLAWKGGTFEYSSNNLGLVKSIDLSSNKLMGEIPLEITHLSGLVALNLSRNNLVGRIPLKIGLLRSLESLDLSRNQLFGEIPGSMSDLNYLSSLDLSYNNLSGKIPSSTQLQLLEPSAFYKNRALCGPPLTQKCGGNDTFEGSSTTGGSEHSDIQEDEYELVSDRWFYASLVFGFIVGFWGVCGTLVLHRSWRHAYFRFFDNSKDWLYVRMAVHTSKLKRKFWVCFDT